MRKSILLIFLFVFGALHAQDTIDIHQATMRNQSIANHFTLYESKDFISFQDFLKSKNQGIEGKKLDAAIENLDFTSSTYFIEFVVKNTSDKAYWINLEIARPITNTVDLYSCSTKEVKKNGDAIPFNKKSSYSNKCVHPILI